MHNYNYEQVKIQIENMRRFGNLPGVEVTKRMLSILGEPQKGLPYIHVAGTNGKGSTCAFLASILSEAGLRVGLFTSPHLVEFEERIMVGRQMIPKEDVTRLGNMLLSIDFGLTPTMFDYCLAMAILYFKEQHCDVAVIETGLGGRLDSTNALGKPVAAVINRIGYDHMAVLGNTLEEIAEEKAGILKPGVRAVFAPQEEKVLTVLMRYADGQVVQESDMEAVREMGPGLMGSYQLENAAAAMLAARAFWEVERSRISSVGVVPRDAFEKAIQKGIHNTVWPGRMEILSESPFLLVDGAHNQNGIHALKESLEKLYPGEKFRFFMGVMADKAYETMVEELLPLAADFVTVTPESSRGLQGETLAETIRSRGVGAQSLGSISDMPEALSKKEKNIALGSLYFIGELRAWWKGKQV